MIQRVVIRIVQLRSRVVFVKLIAGYVAVIHLVVEVGDLVAEAATPQTAVIQALEVVLLQVDQVVVIPQRRVIQHRVKPVKKRKTFLQIYPGYGSLLLLHQFCLSLF